jgi:biopolymer transport protein ExbD
MAFDVRDSDGEELQPSADINVTPFIDVMLVLLIIFMVTAPMMTQGMKVELPKATSAAAVDSKKAVTITMAADGSIQVGDTMVRMDQLVDVVRAEASDPEQPIRIRGDVRANYGVVVDVIDQLTRSGLTKLQFLTNPRLTPPSK